MIPDTDEIYLIAHSRLVPPKLRANYWKFITCSYKLADRKPFATNMCTFCNVLDTHFHRFVTCSTAITGWKIIFKHFLGQRKDPSDLMVMKLILGNFTDIDGFQCSFVTILVHCCLWTTHTLHVQRRPQDPGQETNPPSSQHTVNLLLENIHKCLYTALVSGTLPKRHHFDPSKYKMFTPVTFDKTKRTVTILPPNPTSY